MEQTLKNSFLVNTETAENISQEHTLFYDAVHNCVVSEWQGFVSKKLLIDGAYQSLSMLARHGCANLLVDHRRVHGTWADLSDWQLNIWLPQALQAGLKRYTVVAWSGSYSALASEISFPLLSPQVDMMLFSDLADAKNWISEG